MVSIPPLSDTTSVPLLRLRVVPQPANQRVSTKSAVEHVGRRISRDPVRKGVAGAVDRRGAQQRQVLDGRIGSQ